MGGFLYKKLIRFVAATPILINKFDCIFSLIIICSLLSNPNHFLIASELAIFSPLFASFIPSLSSFWIL